MYRFFLGIDRRDSDVEDIIYTHNPYMLPCQTCGKFFNTFPIGSIVKVNYEGKVIQLIKCKECQEKRMEGFEHGK